MSSTHHAHAYLRTSPPAVKKPAVKGPPRSALSSRITASHKLTLRGGNKSKAKPEKEKERGKQKKDVEEEDEGLAEGDKEAMGTSFLQYWYPCRDTAGWGALSLTSELDSAMCEKQIVVPNNSILYCSESCRRKDASDTPAAVPYLSLFNPSFQHHAVGQDSDLVLGAKARTGFRRHESAPHLITQRMPSMAHEGKSDLDPSEWKPKTADRASSDAFHYLGQFHCSPATIRRPTLQTRATLASAAITTTPSLSHTPATSTSSEESVAGTPYEFVTRPLLPRLDPKYCTSAGIKSVDLVTPHLPSSALSGSANDAGAGAGADLNPVTHTKEIGLSSGTTSGDVSFEKKWIVPRSSIAVGSLKKLLEIGNSSAFII